MHDCQRLIDELKKGPAEQTEIDARRRLAHHAGRGGRSRRPVQARARPSSRRHRGVPPGTARGAASRHADSMACGRGVRSCWRPALALRRADGTSIQSGRSCPASRHPRCPSASRRLDRPERRGRFGERSLRSRVQSRRRWTVDAVATGRHQHARLRCMTLMISTLDDRQHTKGRHAAIESLPHPVGEVRSRKPIKDVVTPAARSIDARAPFTSTVCSAASRRLCPVSRCIIAE